MTIKDLDHNPHNPAEQHLPQQHISMQLFLFITIIATALAGVGSSSGMFDNVILLSIPISLMLLLYSNNTLNLHTRNFHVALFVVFIIHTS